MPVSKDQKITRYGTQDGHQPTYQPMKASVSIYAGTIALTDSTGYAKTAASPTSNDTCWGLYNGLADGTPTASSPIVNGTVAGGIMIGIDTGTFYLASGLSSDAITQANVGAACYVVDEVTVGLTSNANTRPVAGRIAGIGLAQYAGLVAVTMGNDTSTGSP